MAMRALMGARRRWTRTLPRLANTLSQDTALAEKISASPATQRRLAGMRKEKEEIQERLRSAKPFEQQAKALASRTERAKKLLEKQRATIQDTCDKIEGLQKDLAEQKFNEMEQEQVVA